MSFEKPFRAVPLRHYPRRQQRRQEVPFVFQVAGSMLFVGLMTFQAAPQLSAWWASSTMSPTERTAVEQSVTYSGCNEARAAGAAPIHRGEPGYRRDMDGDDDWIACEDY